MNKQRLMVAKDGTVHVRGCTKRLAKVEKRSDGWALLKMNGELRRGGFKSRRAAVDALPAQLEREQAARRRAWEKSQRERKAREKLARKEAKDPRCVEKYAERIAAAAPEGWTVEIERDAHRYGRGDWEVSRYTPDEENAIRRYESLKGAITVWLRSEREEMIWRVSRARDWQLDNGAVSADGSTYFVSDKTGGWHCFDRHGISDSFYTGSLHDPAEIVQAQLARINKCRADSVNFVSIPGLPYSIHKDRIEEVKSKLRSGGSHLFTPHGMGTAHRVSKRPGRYAERLSGETAAFFGCEALYSEQVDWD